MQHKKLRTDFVSEHDILLAELRKKKAPSAAVKREVAKYEKIFMLRDKVQTGPAKSK